MYYKAISINPYITKIYITYLYRVSFVLLMGKKRGFQIMADIDKKVQTLIYGAIMSILASTVSAMLSQEKNVWTRLKTFIAGSVAGVLLHFIFLNFEFSQGWKDIAAALLAAFVSSYWPLLGILTEKFIKAYGKKKIGEQDDSVSNNKSD